MIGSAGTRIITPCSVTNSSGATIVHLNQKSLAERWDLSPRTLEQWRWQGRGPVYLKIHNHVVYRLIDIEAFEAAHLHANTSGPLPDMEDEDAR